MKEETFRKADELKKAIKELTIFITTTDVNGTCGINWHNSPSGVSFNVRPFMSKDVISAMVSLRDSYKREFESL